VKKELIGTTPSGTSIYRVDGPEVRNTLDINFALGAHGLIKDYIPKDEIWVEAVVDECANLGHEIREYERMKGAGLSYDKAHEEANQYEHELRQSGTCSVTDLLKAPANPRVKEPWQMTKVGYAEAQIQKSRTLIEAWNKAGSHGFPPTAQPSIYEIAPLAEKAGYIMPRDAEMVLKKSYHRLQVEAAIHEGKPIPTDVLKDYPDLQAKIIPKAEAEGKCH